MQVAAHMMQTILWILRWIIILGLALLLAMGLLYTAYGILEVFGYYWFSKKVHQYPINLDAFYLALKILAFYLVSILLLSQYRASPTNKAIVKRSLIAGLVIASLLIGALALDRIMMHYYANVIDCNLPDPNQKPVCITN